MDGDAKIALRRELLAVRRSLPTDVIAAASTAVADRLRTLPELAGTRDVLLYAADPDEVALDVLITAPPAGWRVLLPRVDGGEVVAVLHRAGVPLVPGYRGIREPVGPAVDAATLDAVIVPGVAFSPSGQRLGRGAGLYDRLLPRTGGAVRVGVTLEGFVRDELPVEAHDAAVDVVVTDASVRRRTATGTDASA